LRNAGGGIFGIGSSTTAAFWIEINVGSSTGGGYDFTAHAAEATWSSGAGVLGFPVADGDARGFAFKQDNPKFESGFQLGKPGLLVAPQNLYNGYIQARYPAVRVQTGDRFQATVGCEFNATSCYVAYRLDYQIGNGPIRTYWTFREKYEGWTYFANLNLNSLAGQDVNFILFISAYGNATGDRALWGNPVIMPTGGTIVTSTPTVTGTPPTATPTSTKPTPTNTLAASSCDKVKFEKDVTYPDGTVVPAGTTFNKTWRLRNIGTCTWQTTYQLVFYSGQQMGGPSAINFPTAVGPNQTVELTVTLTAPNTAGSYRGFWMFRNASGQNFGIGFPNYNLPWWVDITVTGSSGPTSTFTPTPTTTFTPTITLTPTSTATPTATPQ
jgi:hypothetical protein